jgi:hypothetical protein
VPRRLNAGMSAKPHPLPPGRSKAGPGRVVDRLERSQIAVDDEIDWRGIRRHRHGGARDRDRASSTRPRRIRRNHTLRHGCRPERTRPRRTRTVLAAAARRERANIIRARRSLLAPLIDPCAPSRHSSHEFREYDSRTRTTDQSGPRGHVKTQARHTARSTDVDAALTTVCRLEFLTFSLASLIQGKKDVLFADKWEASREKGQHQLMMIEVDECRGGRRHPAEPNSVVRPP